MHLNGQKKKNKCHQFLNDAMQVSHRLMSAVRAKFAWVNDMPYALWQARAFCVIDSEFIAFCVTLSKENLLSVLAGPEVPTRSQTDIR